MKNFFYKSFLLLCLTILFQKCSSENLITAPTEPPQTTNQLNKKTFTNTDTTKLTIKTPNGLQDFYFADKLTEYEKTQIIKYLSTHEITQGGVMPNAYECGTKTTHAWTYENEYKSVPNKFLGIWTNIISFQKCYDTYGFSQIFVSSSQITTAQAAHFKLDSMMLGLSRDLNSAISTIQDSPAVGSYFIDEPLEHQFYSIPNISQYLAVNRPNSKLFLSSYTWPYFSVCNSLGQSADYTGLLSFNNTYIMCDQYRGDCCGFTDDYWTEYRDYYGWNKSISNWLHLIENNGGSSRYVCPGPSNNFHDLLGDANEAGINKIWLYALSSTGGHEYDINYFCEAAWIRGWLLRKYGYATIYWRCHYQNPCENCDPTLPDGWYIDEVFMNYESYVPY